MFFSGGGWEAEDDLELPVDADVTIPEEGDGSYFVAPTRGISLPQQWTNNSKLVVDHVLAGSFESAARLLHDQIGVVELEPFKQLFVSSYSRSRATFYALPDMPALYLYPLRNYKDAKSQVPAIGLKLNDLIQRLQVSLSLPFMETLA